MQDTSVVITTRRRPEFLSKALESVAKQSAIGRVGEILVIENGEDRRSEAVCQNHPELPIRYIYRDPVTPGSRLIEATFSEPMFPLSAWLHDDDWWLDHHLERSLKALDERPGCPAVYSSHITMDFVDSRDLWFRGVNGNFAAWFGNDEAENGIERTLNYKQMLVTSIFQAGLHMSSIVCRTAAVRACFPAFQDGNDYDVDRTLPVELSRLGDVLFFDAPSLVVRSHLNQDGKVAETNGRSKYWFHYNSLRMIKQAADASIDLRAEIACRISRPGFDSKEALRRIATRAFDCVAEASMLPEPLLSEYRRKKRALRSQKLVKSLQHRVEDIKKVLGCFKKAVTRN